MNTLTKNRILQDGDEYLDFDKGEWKPVPATDFGLQIMFTKYGEVRRPSETPSANGAGETPAPQRSTATVAAPSVENKPTASPLPREYPAPKPLSMTMTKSGKAKALPTVVSAKAHTLPPLRLTRAEIRMTKPLTRADYSKAAKAAKAAKKVTSGKIPASAGVKVTPLPTSLSVSYPASPECVWTGRNGTFTARALNMHVTPSGEVIQIVPQGKRGAAKSAIIEFPASIIPQVVDWLLRQQPTPTTTPAPCTEKTP